MRVSKRISTCVLTPTFGFQLRIVEIAGICADWDIALIENALTLVGVENQPRYESIQWYFDSRGLEFESVIKTISSIPKLYEPAVL
jgi:hypothetical protein